MTNENFQSIASLRDDLKKNLEMLKGVNREQLKLIQMCNRDPAQVIEGKDEINMRLTVKRNFEVIEAMIAGIRFAQVQANKHFENVKKLNAVQT